MIISHKHRFIFIKTEKTAGTSIELALSALCGPDDVITPVSAQDEHLRNGPGPQNYERHPVTLLDRVLRRRPAPIPSHIGAEGIVRLFGNDIWRTYFKFCFERNPWDRQVSMYHFLQSRRERYNSFEHFLTKRRSFIRNFERYSIAGKIAVDFVGRFENLNDDLHRALEHFGIRESLVLPKAKAGSRPKRHYRCYYTEETRELIRRRYIREIQEFGYEF